MNRLEVSNALDTLSDWMIITGEYGETTKGRAGYCFCIDTKDGGDNRIEKLYEQHWKDARQNEGCDSILRDSVR
jgi:hypothetical protein